MKSWPASELEYWSCYFSINDNKDQAIITRTTAEEKSEFRQLMRRKNGKSNVKS